MLAAKPQNAGKPKLPLKRNGKMSAIKNTKESTWKKMGFHFFVTPLAITL